MKEPSGTGWNRQPAQELNLKRVWPLLVLAFFLTLSSAGRAQASPLYVDYYGVVSESGETNILKMAQDIFLTQLKSIANISVDDKRISPNETLREKPDLSEAAGRHHAFYAEIAEQAGSDSAKLWQCTFTVIGADSRVTTKTEQYDSYYKILTNAKSAIEALLEASGQTAANPAEDGRRQAFDDGQAQSHGAAGRNVSVSSLAGTWQGEASIDKIVLLRGGKGFVIYKNGASMNVKVAVTHTDSAGNIIDMEVTQDSKGNASFYPQLPRETALQVAANAPPIIWILHASGEGVFTGTKKTLLPDGSSPQGAREGMERITWTKK